MKTSWHFSAHPIGLLCLLAALLLKPIRQLAAVLVARALHEGAHLLAIRLCKVRHCSIEWTPLGFVAQAEGFSALPASKRLWIALSGLLASGLLAAVSRVFLRLHPFWYLCFTANMGILLLNALPILPLDGGRVLLALAACFGWERGAKKCLLILSYTMAVLITALGLYSLWVRLPNPTLLMLGPYLAYAARQSSLQGGEETLQMLHQRAHPANGVYPMETCAVIGHTDTLSLVKILRRTSPETFVLFQTIDPEKGHILSSETQQQMIVNLLSKPVK